MGVHLSNMIWELDSKILLIMYSLVYGQDVDSDMY